MEAEDLVDADGAPLVHASARGNLLLDAAIVDDADLDGALAAPAVVIDWLTEPDHSQHVLGVGSPSAREAIRNDDREIARVAHPKGANVNTERENFTAAPLVAEGKILVGQSNGDGGTRGWLASRPACSRAST